MSKTIKENLASRMFDKANILFMILFAFITIYPLYYVAIVSISDGAEVLRGTVRLVPRGVNINSYKAVFKNPFVIKAYGNTLIYTFFGTATNIILSCMCAYPLSIKRLTGRKIFTSIIVFTMFFSGGLIPLYLVVRSLGMLNSIWAIILPGAINTWNMIIMRTFFQNVPESLRESAHIDGANDIIIFVKIILPVSKPIMATMVLFYSVAHWNSFFDALIYLDDNSKYPLQLILRNMLISGNLTEQNTMLIEDERIVDTTIKYACIMVATLPIIMVYPFLQRYFVKGIMIGSLKG